MSFYFLTDFLKYFSEFYMKPVARGSNFYTTFKNTLYIKPFQGDIDNKTKSELHVFRKRRNKN
jgi:hypothetical protein